MNRIIDLFNIQLASGHFSLLLLLLAFLGGVLMCLSPCNLAILPLIVGYVAGSEEKKISKILLQLLMFFIGFSSVFAVIGVVAAITGQVFSSVLNEYWILFIASIVLIFGLSMLDVIEFNFPVLVKQFPTQFQGHNYLYALLMGMIFALAATPCATPILASIMAATTLAKNILTGAIVLFLFSLGQSMIVILAGLFTSFLKNIKRLEKITQYANVAAGIIFILFALYLYSKVFYPLFV